MANSGAECYCENCKRGIHYMGIARHRAMHRDRQEKVTIRMSTGRWVYDYTKPEPKQA